MSHADRQGGTDGESYFFFCESSPDAEMKMLAYIDFFIFAHTKKDVRTSLNYSRHVFCGRGPVLSDENSVR